MKKLFKRNKFGFMSIVNYLAMALVVSTANAACSWIFGQLEEPEEAKGMRKF
ncbi:cyclic lactone autoinducer peptide [Enterocloster clostridioformis]|uniref:cyclic lactone autoinducer peptide n=1 Tax=Enterocloster clostridioformis TaxID=1531 RepID=UPI00080C50A8|nr:cyclic lactone autoinducer peptide [Enterocloster clostridioformis]ANU49714.1 cyclic lactone autoinducer peptide [Lachnoclostridium sp. YL32]NDO28835.1 cyclic lactone autoinducer peptide [Enterocloster clostridioformis]OXE71234.1 cyclic lactone autoinducer peptide [Enterocloster clostridioformis]QQR01377.1 cyclic lactone autoinducer peptide [Enterocloster clostridioformis]